MDWGRHSGDWPNAACSRFIQTRSHDWHVQRAGEGAGILLLHGAGASSHSWGGMLPRLARRAEVLALDLPGHGFTKRRATRRARLPEMARDIADLLGQEGFVPAIAVGHSAGAAIALQMSYDGAPFRHIVGINPALVPFQGLAGVLFPPLAKLLALNPFSAPFFARTAASDTSVRKLIEGTGSRIGAQGLACYRALIGDAAHVDGALQMMARWNLNPLLAVLPQIETPATFAVGLNDQTVSPMSTETQAARMKTAQVVRFPDLGHLMHEEQPDTFADLVLKVLDEG